MQCSNNQRCRRNPIRSAAAVEGTSTRLLLCARCRTMVVICRRCDRGQMYCNQGCARDARRRNQRDAGHRYQSTDRGRSNHAARSRRYRARRKTVTHQGPLSRPHSPPLNPTAPAGKSVARDEIRKTVTPCHWCGCPCSDFVRLGFLRRRRHSGGSKHHYGHPP